MKTTYPDKDYYYRIDEKQNTLDSLEKVLAFAENIEKDESYWKWTMIALHNALYGSMILSLVGTNPASVRVNAKKEAVPDMNRLISFKVAYKRVQNPKYMRLYVNSRFLTIYPGADKLRLKPEYAAKSEFFSPEVNVSIEHLNDYIRNQFMHFYPISVSYGKGGFALILEDVIRVIKFLILECGNVRIDSPEEELKIRGTISRIEQIASFMKTKYS